MTFLLIILLAGLFALIQLFRSKDTFAKIIHGVYVAGIAVSFIPVPQVAIDGYYLFALCNLLVVLYAFSDDEFSRSKQSILILMGGIQLLGSIFILGGYPYSWLTSLLGIITIGCFVYVLVKDIKHYKNEIGFMVVLTADALIKVSVVLLSSIEGSH